MKNKAIYLEIREDLHDFIDSEVERRKAEGDRGASKVGFVEELVRAYKIKLEKKS